MKKNNFLQPDGTIKTSSTPRVEGTYLYFTSTGDDITNNIVGGGNLIYIDNTKNSSISREVECHFLDDIYLKDGTIMWENAILGDTITWEIILPANTPLHTTNNNGNAQMVNGNVTYITSSSTPDETWVGDYYLFPTDYITNRFVNQFMIIGSNTHGYILESSDAMLVPNIYKMRLTYTNKFGIVNSNLLVASNIEMYRDKTS